MKIFRVYLVLVVLIEGGDPIVTLVQHKILRGQQE